MPVECQKLIEGVWVKGVVSNSKWYMAAQLPLKGPSMGRGIRLPRLLGCASALHADQLLRRALTMKCLQLRAIYLDLFSTRAAMSFSPCRQSSAYLCWELGKLETCRSTQFLDTASQTTCRHSPRHCKCISNPAIGRQAMPGSNEQSSSFRLARPLLQE